MPRTALGARAILKAHRQIRATLPETPLIRSSSLSQASGADVWLKLETQQPTGSFKVRGAFHKLATLKDLSHGVVTGSAGNHGLGVAYAADILGIEPAVIFVPKTAPAAKVRRLKQFTIDLRIAGKTYEHAHQSALEYAREEGACYIPAYDDDDIIAGQGTAGLEIMQALPEVDIVIVPVGGGGLIAGIATAVKELSPAVQILGVQAAASPSAYLSFKDNRPYDPYEHEETIADGLAGGFGARPFYVARTLIDSILLYDEIMLRRCVFALLDRDRIIAEPSGAIAVAPLLNADNALRGKKIVCVISGANLETSLLRDILNEFSDDA